MENWKENRDRIIGLGEKSFHKSYYPELIEKIEELEKSYQNFENIFSLLADAVVVHDYVGQFRFLNQQARTLFNLPSEAPSESYSIADISSDSIDVTRIPEILEYEVFHGSKPLDWSVQPYGKQVDIPVQVTLSKVHWYGEDALVAVVRDFSERKRFEEELVKAKEKAEESDRLKSAFLANMSHEIRTPMNAILGFASLLKRSDLSLEKQSKYIDIIQDGGNRMLNIINDIVDISKIEAGLVDVALVKFNFHDQLILIMDLLGHELERKGLHFDCRVKKLKDPFYILADEEKVYAIVSNLVKNAIKFTKEGSITLSYQIHKEDRGDILKFYVQDTGIGIPENRQEAIFDRFIQADVEDRLVHQGAGLGLAISKAFVELMGGSIGLTSKVGEGSTFYFTLPLK